MDTSFIVTFIGEDRPGIVEQLADVIEQQGGNWLEGKLSQLGGKFAGLVMVSCPDSTDNDALRTALTEALGETCAITVTASGEATAPTAGRDLSLRILGPDRPGIVREVSRALAERSINVVRLHSDVESAPMSAELLFRAAIEARVPEGTDVSQLAEQLDEVANQMTLEIDWE